MSCGCHTDGTVTICYGPPTRTVPLGKFKSAVHCNRCRKRRVQELVSVETIEPSYYGPVLYRRCPCGAKKLSEHQCP